MTCWFHTEWPRRGECSGERLTDSFQAWMWVRTALPIVSVSPPSASAIPRSVHVGRDSLRRRTELANQAVLFNIYPAQNKIAKNKSNIRTVPGMHECKLFREIRERLCGAVSWMAEDTKTETELETDWNLIWLKLAGRDEELGQMFFIFPTKNRSSKKNCVLNWLRIERKSTVH